MAKPDLRLTAVYVETSPLRSRCITGRKNIHGRPAGVPAQVVPVTLGADAENSYRKRWVDDGSHRASYSRSANERAVINSFTNSAQARGGLATLTPSRKPDAVRAASRTFWRPQRGVQPFDRMRNPAALRRSHSERVLLLSPAQVCPRPTVRRRAILIRRRLQGLLSTTVTTDGIQGARIKYQVVSRLHTFHGHYSKLCSLHPQFYGHLGRNGMLAAKKS
ncbi:hypothetical protein OH77DRAFT_276739 [Trametes cingulata]|nr:hypothetical protein OH77DRAFT_276739 [Trametes cingulata]